MSESPKENEVKSNREVKASAFTTFFSDPVNAAQLYEALQYLKDSNANTVIAPDDIFFTTLSGVLFMARKNDMAFTARKKVLVISEHQSTINENMPLRDAIYFGRTMEKLIEPKALYRTRLIPIPTPEFYVFYNGTENFPSEKILKLSDAYLEKTTEPMLDLKVKVININLPEHHPILARCRPLYEYSWFIQRIREYQEKKMNRDESIIRAMDDCLKEGVMVEFIKEHGTEAVNMLFTEFNMEDAQKVWYEEGLEEGERRGREEGERCGRGEGELLKLIQLVVKKLLKGKSAAFIAEELEEEEETINRICKAADEAAPEYDIQQIMEIIKEHKAD